MNKKIALTTLKPSLTKVDLVFSYRSFVRRLLAYIYATVRNHRIKAAVVVGCFYAAYKTLGLYKMLK